MLTLEQICSKLLIKYKTCLGDIGAMPLNLLASVLEACSAEDLLRIETDTRAGGRILEPREMAPYWRKVYAEEFGSCSSKPAHEWKDAYLAKQKELEEKRTRVGKKMRGMWDEEKRRKDSRRIQVIDKVPQSQLRRKDSGKPASPPDARLRLAKKLHINPLSIKSKAYIHRAVLPKAASTGLVEHDIDWGS